MTRLEKIYKEKVAPEMQKEFNYKSPMQIPGIEKISLNIGLGGATQNQKLLEEAVEELSAIAGQKFRAHKWCTLCLITQACLWLSQGCYILMGAWHATFPIVWGAAVLVAVYAAVFMTLNILNPYLTRK